MSDCKKPDCDNCDLDTILDEIQKCNFECIGGTLEFHRGYMALVKKTYQLQAEKESLKSHIKLTQANVDGLILENDALEDEIQRLKEALDEREIDRNQDTYNRALKENEDLKEGEAK